MNKTETHIFIKDFMDNIDDPENRDLVERYFFGGGSYREIAATHHLEYGAIRNRILNAIAQTKAHLGIE